MQEYSVADVPAYVEWQQAIYCIFQALKRRHVVGGRHTGAVLLHQLQLRPHSLDIARTLRRPRRAGPCWGAAREAAAAAVGKRVVSAAAGERAGTVMLPHMAPHGR